MKPYQLTCWTPPHEMINSEWGHIPFSKVCDHTLTHLKKTREKYEITHRVDPQGHKQMAIFRLTGNEPHSYFDNRAYDSRKEGNARKVK